MGFKLPSFNWFKGKRDKSAAGPRTSMGLSTTLVMKSLQQIAGGESGKPLPFIGDKPLKKQMQILGVAWAITVLLSFLPLVWYGVNLYILKQHTGVATEMQMLSQRIAKGAQQAALGSPLAFTQLKEAEQRFSADIKNLTEGGGGMPASPSALQPLLKDMNKQWTDMRKDISTLLSEQTEQLTAQLLQSGASPREVHYSGQLTMMSERLAKNANSLLTGDEADPEDTFMTGRGIPAFRNVMNGLLSGSEGLHLSPIKDADARDTLGQIKETFAEF